MNPFDVNQHYEVTVRTSRKKKSHSKVFDYLMKCLREGKHSHMLRYKAGSNKTKFEVHFHDMKVHHQWNPKCISLFAAVDKIVKERRQKEKNYYQNTKNRFKSNMRKLENKYIEYLYEDKISTALRVKSYRILKPSDISAAVHQTGQQNTGPAVFQNVEPQQFQVPGGSSIVAPPGREIDNQGSQSVAAVHQARQQNTVPAFFQNVELQQFQVPGGSSIVAPPGREIDNQGSQSVDVQSQSGIEINEIPDEDEIVNVEYVEEENSSFTCLPGWGCSRSSDWSELEKQDQKGNVMVSSVSETTLVLVEMTDSLEVQDGSEFSRILRMNFPDLKEMHGYQPSGVTNSEMEKVYDTLDIMNINDNDAPGIMNSKIIIGNDIMGFMNSDMRNGNDTLGFVNLDTINGYGKLDIMNSEKNRYEVGGNYVKESDYPCLLGDYEDMVPLNSYQNDLILDFGENSDLHADPFIGEKPNIEVSSNEMALDSDFDFDGEVDIETISVIDWRNEFSKFNS